MDPSWSETGDRYLLKLFRDYLFHQVTENGVPWVDLAHIVACLNKVNHAVNQFFKLFLFRAPSFALKQLSQGVLKAFGHAQNCL